jgi:hypothetical protein
MMTSGRQLTGKNPSNNIILREFDYAADRLRKMLLHYLPQRLKPYMRTNVIKCNIQIVLVFRDDIKHTRCRLWPQTKVHDEEDQRRKDEKEKERKLRAKERQQKVMEQFASQQKIFLDNIQEKGTVQSKQAVVSIIKK